ncbi:hypothetical protein GPX89_17630 [Nocardia sp. ET3-3]|uniref:LppU protein n=1 Tax=Nocardia terrae TaxID=2675851 RepID=A0A7K1UXR0_9NOCA|nr:hypothetical protein [Nocardia terrae]MVU79061.1 hypothetical protein [Nocardia terrae]
MSRRKGLAGITLACLLAGAMLAVVAGLFTILLASLGHRRPGPVPDENLAAANTSVRVSPEDAAPQGNTEPESGGFASAVHRTATVRIPGRNVNAGDCVEFGADATHIEKVACGSGNSGYKVSDVAAQGGRCPRDADRTVARPVPGAPDTLCLDIDWVVGDCMDLTAGNARRTDCAADIPDSVRVVQIEQGTADVNTCSAGNRGFVYDERRIVVCVSSR